MGTGDLNLDPHGCVAGPVISEPSSQTPSTELLEWILELDIPNKALSLCEVWFPR